MTLQIIWYMVIVLAVICYAMLDGFDLGVGILHPFAKTDRDRRIFLNAIGPVWDGNEVWIVIVGGALFAGFPEVFATLFSTFYIPVMILLMGLIFRAVSIEFRSKRESHRWRHTWDMIFFLGSLVITFGVGIVLGNLIEGLPLDKDHVFVGTFKDFVRPYTLLMGVMTITLFALHGSIFLAMKTKEGLHNQIRKWVPKLIAAFIFMYLLVTVVTFYQKPYMITSLKQFPMPYLIPILAFICIFSVPFLMRKKFDGWAFLASCLSIALLLSLAALGLYPNMIQSSLDPQTNSLTIFNSASSQLTLKILLIIVAIGVPLVLAYGFYIYRTFRGKVEIDTASY